MYRQRRDCFWSALYRYGFIKTDTNTNSTIQIIFSDSDWKNTECGFRTFVLRLKYHPTLVWKMFLVPVQPDWKQHPSKRTNIIQPLSWKLWKRVWTVKCFFFAYRKPEQSLRSDHNERLAEVTNHLSPQQVEVLSGSGGVDHSHVHIVSVHTLFFTVAHLSDKRGRVCYHLHFR